MAHWLVTRTGRRLRVTQAGVVNGRQSGCAFVLSHPQVSRHQAVVRLGETGPELLVTGGGGVRVNDQSVTGTVAVQPGAPLV